MNHTENFCYQHDSYEKTFKLLISESSTTVSNKMQFSTFWKQPHSPLASDLDSWDFQQTPTIVAGSQPPPPPWQLRWSSSVHKAPPLRFASHPHLRRAHSQRYSDFDPNANSLLNSGDGVGFSASLRHWRPHRKLPPSFESRQNLHPFWLKINWFLVFEWWRTLSRSDGDGRSWVRDRW